MTSIKPMPAGESWLFSFPFWLIVDRSSMPQTVETEIKGLKVRIYPPFRSGAANFIPMPFVDPLMIPFKEGTRPDIASNYKIFRLASFPRLQVNEQSKTGVQLLWGEEWENQLNEFPKDSLRLDMEGSHDLPDLAQDLVLRLLQLLRVRTGQWWITRSTDALLGYIRNSFPVTESGAPLEPPLGYASARTVSGFEKPIDDAIWKAAITDLANLVDIDESRLMLLDVYYHAAARDFRLALLDAATAAEQAAEVTFERLWCAKTTSKFKRGRVMPGDGLPDYISADMKRFIGRSYSNEHPGNFARIEDLWLARGSVAHGGLAAWTRNGQRNVVNNEVAANFAVTVRHCIEWLESL